MKRFLINTLKVIMLPVIVYLIFLVICFERFSNWNCIYTIFIQTIIPTITAYAIAYGNICGVFDFTIGSRLVISGVIGGLLAAQYGFAGMILGAIISAIVVGIITGVLNWWLKIPSLVLTMGLAMVFEIVGSKLAGHYGFVQIDNKYAIFGSSPNIVIIFLLSAVLFYFIFNHTVFSFHMRAVGSNEAVAKNSGIKTDLVKCKSFVYGSVFIGIAAILTLSQSGSVGAQTSLGSVTIMFKPLISVLLALVLQRICDLTVGIFIAQFTLNIIFIGLIAVGLPDTFQNVVLGFFLLVVMILFENSGRLEELKEKKEARQKAMSAS
jgi:ribose transport system permease protein